MNIKTNDPYAHADGSRECRPAEGIEATLAERGSRYGDWTEHSRVLDNIVLAMEDSSNWRAMPPFQRQALRTIADKMARMLTGDPTYADNAHDMVGYARLIEDRLVKLAEERANGPGLFSSAALANGATD